MSGSSVFRSHSRALGGNGPKCRKQAVVLLENRERDEHAVADHEQDGSQRLAAPREVDEADQERQESDRPEDTGAGPTAWCRFGGCPKGGSVGKSKYHVKLRYFWPAARGVVGRTLTEYLLERPLSLSPLDLRLGLAHGRQPLLAAPTLQVLER